MATDCGAPRKQDEELREDSLEQLKARHLEYQLAEVGEDEVKAAKGFKLPRADLSSAELSISVVSAQDGEFMCPQYFLVHYRSRLAYEGGGLPVYMECAG